MKKLVCIAILMLNFMGYLAIANDPGNISALAKKSFEKQFPHAQFAVWKEITNENLYQVRFVDNNQSLLVYVDMEGEMLAIARNVSQAQLPLTAQRILKEKYGNYAAKEITELVINDSLSYMVNLKENRWEILLRIYPSGEAIVINKMKIRG